MSILSKLSKNKSNWRSILKPLAKEDIHHLLEKGENESDGKKTISWIWIVQGVAESDSIGNAGMQEGESLKNSCHNLQSSPDFKFSVSNGVKPVHAPDVGPKRWSYYSRKIGRAHV